jgi:hypothetical protein
LSGLKGSDWIVLNPPDDIENGQQVNVKQVNSPIPTPQVPPGGKGHTAPGTANPSAGS